MIALCVRWRCLRPGRRRAAAELLKMEAAGATQSCFNQMDHGNLEWTRKSSVFWRKRMYKPQERNGSKAQCRGALSSRRTWGRIIHRTTCMYARGRAPSTSIQAGTPRRVPTGLRRRSAAFLFRGCVRSAYGGSHCTTPFYVFF